VQAWSYFSFQILRRARTIKIKSVMMFFLRRKTSKQRIDSQNLGVKRRNQEKSRLEREKWRERDGKKDTWRKGRRENKAMVMGRK
jgi:hypothetical protein